MIALLCKDLCLLLSLWTHLLTKVYIKTIWFSIYIIRKNNMMVKKEMEEQYEEEQRLKLLSYSKKKRLRSKEMNPYRKHYIKYLKEELGDTDIDFLGQPHNNKYLSIALDGISTSEQQIDSFDEWFEKLD